MQINLYCKDYSGESGPAGTPARNPDNLSEDVIKKFQEDIQKQNEARKAKAK